jgi:tetrahydromethanopterin:alpha-L-glutamate ligase
LTGRLALFTDDAGWHGKQLRLAFAQHDYEAEFVSLTECRFDIQANQPVIKIPGFEQKLLCV